MAAKKSAKKTKKKKTGQKKSTARKTKTKTKSSAKPKAKAKSKTNSKAKSKAKPRSKTQSAPTASSLPEAIRAGYQFEEASIRLGNIKLGDEVTDAPVNLPLSTLNRHGLIAGATGTGKTKTVQVITEHLSAAGVPTVLMDLKGDLSGLARPGENKEFILQRHAQLDLPYQPRAVPVELFSLSKEKGARLRATPSEFGPILLARMLDLNDTQAGILAVIFRFCDDHGLLLLDLKDVKAALRFIQNEGKEQIEADYGSISGRSIATIMRKITMLEAQGAAEFFGERSLDVTDLMEVRNGEGVVSVVRLTDVVSKPVLFSTFMLSLLSELFETLPEAGDADKPKLILILDEAHLIFDNASPLLKDKLEQVVRLIRSKGVGLFFCTQNPTDLPPEILSQLGLKVQHALRAFTAKDRKAIKSMAENFPESELYELDSLLTELGIGEALVTALSPQGRPTPVVHTYLRAPVTRMGILTAMELDELLKQSQLVEKYGETIDRESAYEMLGQKVVQRQKDSEQKNAANQSATKKTKSKKVEEPTSTLEEIADSKLARDIGRTVARELTRGVLGSLGIKKTTSRRSSRRSRKSKSTAGQLADLLGDLF